MMTKNQIIISSLRCTILKKEVTKGIEKQSLDPFCLQFETSNIEVDLNFLYV